MVFQHVLLIYTMFIYMFSIFGKASQAVDSEAVGALAGLSKNNENAEKDVNTVYIIKKC